MFSNFTNPAYQFQHPNYTTNFIFCQPLILYFFKFLFAHLYFNQLAATSNGLEVYRHLYNHRRKEPGIQSNPTFCPYRFNTAYTLPCTSDSLPNQFWPYQPGRIEPLRGIDNSPLYVYLCRLHFGQAYSAINYGNYSIDLLPVSYSTLANWTMTSSKS